MFRFTHVKYIISDCMKFLLLIRTYYCVALSRYFLCELQERKTCAAKVLIFHHIINNAFCKVPTSQKFTCMITFSLSPYQFSLFVMSDMKDMGSFEFTLTHASLKYPPSASSFDPNVSNNCMKDTPPQTTCATQMGTIE